MGQTLTHGIYLPDKGERNCYNGLAANWQLLDGAVGTIAEHTSALAGKAPLVHTHTKADITDFPALANVATSGSYNDLNNIPASFTPSSHTHGNLTNDGKVGTTANVPLITGTDGVVQAGSFGNAANTFCEGNDSRLSDARTPVAHTHTKSDVTDLFNSANTWAEGQTIYNYANIQSQVLERAVTPASTAHVSFNLRDKNNHDLGIFRSLTYAASRNSIITIFGVTQIKDGQVDPTGTVESYGFTETCKPDGTKYFTFDGYIGSWLEPLSANQSIGTSTHQWNNLYAKSYFYNGTAWGLDKVNTWSANNSFYDITIYGKQTNTFQSNSSVGEKGDASVFALNIQVQDKNHAGWSSSGVANIGMGQDNNGSYISFGLDTKDSNDTRRNSSVSFLLKPTDNSNNAYFFPNRDNTVDLGTSTNKWKTLNGINPGALSFPKIVSAESRTIDITNWDFTGTNWNTLNTSAMTGWGYIYIEDCSTTDFILVRRGGTTGIRPTQSANPILDNNGKYYLYITFPIVQNASVYALIRTTGTVSTAVVYPCQGNV